MVLYGSVTWTLSQKAISVILTFERKIIGKIFRATQVKGPWRIRCCEEIYELYEDMTLSTFYA
jgi:hypothetical protein